MKITKDSNGFVFIAVLSGISPISETALPARI
jgi:hypothetical protein